MSTINVSDRTPIPMLTKSEKITISGKFNLNKDALCDFPGNISLLVKLGISLDTSCGPEKNTPFTTACDNGNFYFIERILKENINLEYTNKNGRTGLLLACNNGDYRVVDLLLDNNVNIHHRDNLNNNTAIMLAALKGNLKIVKMLYFHGANLEDKGQNDYNVFLMAVGSGNVDLVKFLLYKGVDIDYKTQLGNSTALLNSVKCGNLDMVKLLVGYGANKNITDKFSGHTASSLAGSLNFKNIQSYLNKRKNESSS